MGVLNFNIPRSKTTIQMTLYDYISDQKPLHIKEKLKIIMSSEQPNSSDHKHIVNAASSKSSDECQVKIQIMLACIIL